MSFSLEKEWNLKVQVFCFLFIIIFKRVAEFITLLIFRSSGRTESPTLRSWSAPVCLACQGYSAKDAFDGSATCTAWNPTICREKSLIWRTAGGRPSRWPTAAALQRCLPARFSMRADRRQQLGERCPRPSRLAPLCERGGVPDRGDHKDSCSKEACSKKKTCNIYTRSFNLHLR